MGYKLTNYWKEIGKEIEDELSELSKTVAQLEAKVKALESKVK